ncbi:kinase-like domain-containing protein [Aspergillus floccosus]
MEHWHAQVDEIFTELGRKTLMSSVPTVPRPFITRANIKRIWETNDRIRNILGEDMPPGLHAVVKDKLLVILSVLIEIGAVETLRDFHQKLFATDNPLQPICTDQEMPLPRERISQFLTLRSQVALFEERQNKFCPVIIACSQLFLTPGEDRPLPFEDTDRMLGRGSYGSVYAVRIAAECFRDEKGLSSSDPYRVACKRLGEHGNFETEMRNLRVLRNSLSQQSHILQTFAMISHGNSRYILTPYVEHGDLYGFLNEGQLDDTGSYDFRSRFPLVSLDRGDSSVFKPLLQQCRHLADAIRWLHEDVTTETGGRIYFTHMDLKPDNILIGRHPGSTVGKWIISDFGISVPREAPPPAPPTMGREFTIYTHPRRPRGTYQAPEFKSHSGVGRKSDVWSFACILNMVLAWAIGRKCGVDEFATTRKKGGHLDLFYEVTSGPDRKLRYHVNSSVIEWLNHIENTPQPHRVAGCWAAAIQKLLIVEPQERPDSNQLLKRMNHVYTHCNHLSEPQQNEIYENCRSTSPKADGWAPPVAPNADNMPRALGRSARVRPSLKLLEQLSPSRIPPEDITAIRRHIARREAMVAVSHTTHNGKVPVVYFGWGLLLAFDLDLKDCSSVPRGLWRIADAGDRDWDQRGIAVEGPYFCAWGYCRTRRRMRCILGHLDMISKRVDLSSDALQPLKSVAMSPRGTAAFVRNNDIIVRSRWDDPSDEIFLQCSEEDRQRFMHAVFDKSGNRLYAWAQGTSKDSLYLWKCTGSTRLEQLSVTNYERRGARTPMVPVYKLQAGCAIMPYESQPGCVFVATDRREYFSLLLQGGPGGTFEERMRIVFKNTLDSVTCGDKVLIRLEKSYIHFQLKECQLPQGADAAIGPTRQLCRLQSDYEESSVLRAFITRLGQVAVLCNADGTVEFVEFSD